MSRLLTAGAPERAPARPPARPPAGDGMALRFVLAVLATWRISHLLAEEDGPFDVIVRLRARAGDGQLGSLMDCFHCVSVWVAAPLCVCVARRGRPTPIVWLALSGAAGLLEQATKNHAPDLDQEIR